MATLVLTTQNQLIDDDEWTVTSAVATNLKAILPEIDDGSGITVAAGFATMVSSTGAGDVEIVDIFGRRVALVQAGKKLLFEATGDVTRPVWVVSDVMSVLSIAQAQPSAGSTTAALGTTSPAASATVKWIGPVSLLDGTVAYIPCWS